MRVNGLWINVTSCILIVGENRLWMVAAFHDLYHCRANVNSAGAQYHPQNFHFNPLTSRPTRVAHTNEREFVFCFSHQKEKRENKK